MYNVHVLLDAYVRVSRVGGREGASFISPDVQRERIERFAMLKGHEIGETFVDLDQSGGKLERPGLDRALERIRRGESGGIIVAKVDRFARSLVKALETIAAIEEAGGEVLIADGDLDTTTPTGKMFLRLMLTLAEFEIDRIRESWDGAQARAVSRGIHVASRVPTGYTKREDGRLEPDPAAAPIIHQLFARRAAGDGWKTLAKWMNTTGAVGPYQNLYWTPTTLSKIIGNRVYLGEARSGQYANPQAHPSIVSRVEWEAAQSARTVATGRNGDGALLAGLVRCAGCRYIVKADTMKGRDGKRLRIYRCRKHRPAGECPAPATIMGRILEPWVEGRFLDDVSHVAEPEAANDDLDEAVRQLEAAEYELTAFRDETIIGVLGQEAFAAGLQKRAEAVEAARRKVQALSADPGRLPDVELTPGELREAWPLLGVTERRAILTAGIDAVFVRSGGQAPVDERAVILWAGDAPSDLPRRGHRVPLASFVWPE